MIRFVRVLAAIMTVFPTLLSAAPAAPDDATPPLHLTACTAGKSKLPAHCGTLRVYEDRVTQGGRTIELHFVEIDAAHPTNRAVFFNPGGPGGDDLSMVDDIADGGYLKALRKLRASYNLVFLDNRGTGKSHPLQCDLYPSDHPEYYYRQLWPDARLKACRTRLSKNANLSMYNSDITTGDIDDLRAALRYPKIVLYGGSYGTMLYLDYARRYPARVESLVLQGVAPPGILIIPLEDPQGAQKAMTDLISDCSRDTVCHEHFPQLGKHFAAVIQRFDNGPIPVRIINSATKREQTVLLSKEVFADRLRDLLYADEAAAYVPYVIEQAYQKNYMPLGRMIELATDFTGRGLDMGLTLSVTCAEDIPFITPEETAKTSAGSFQGDTRVRAQQRACKIWNVAPAASSFVTPVRSTAPILMIGFSEDPASPPEYAREALPYLPNARLIVIPHASHETELDCMDNLIVSFVTGDDAKHLDANHCTGSSQRPPFATSLAGLPE